MSDQQSDATGRGRRIASNAPKTDPRTVLGRYPPRAWLKLLRCGAGFTADSGVCRNCGSAAVPAQQLGPNFRQATIMTSLRGLSDGDAVQGVRPGRGAGVRCAPGLSSTAATLGDGSGGAASYRRNHVGKAIRPLRLAVTDSPVRAYEIPRWTPPPDIQRQWK